MERPKWVRASGGGIVGRYRDLLVASTSPAGTDPQLDEAAAAMAREMLLYAWEWGVFRDDVGIVFAAWREGPEYPEAVGLEARSATALAEEIGVYLDGLQAAWEIPCASGARMLEPSHGGPA